MTESQLKYLIASVHYGSFTKAAEALFVEPQTISNAIKTLEKELHVKLFERSNRGTVPTFGAVTLAEKASKIVARFKDMKDYASILAAQERTSCDLSGSLNLAIFSSSYEGEAISRKYLSAFQARYPEILLSSNYCASGPCLIALEQGIVDAALMPGLYEGDKFSSAKVLDVPLCAVVSKAHPLSNNPCLSLADIIKYPIAKPHDFGFYFLMLEGHLRRAGFDGNYHKPMTYRDEYDIFVHHELGVGFTLSSEVLAARHSDVVFIEIVDAEVKEIPICILRKQDNELLGLLLDSLWASKEL